MPLHLDPADPGADALDFLAERHLATLTVTTPSGKMLVAPVGFTYDLDARLARVITWASAHKARSVEARPGLDVVLCQVDGGRWLSLYGAATLAGDAVSVAEGERRYTDRYRPPKQRTDRVVLEIAVERIIGRV